MQLVCFLQLDTQVHVVIGVHIVNIQTLGSCITILEKEINQILIDNVTHLLINKILFSIWNCKLHKYPYYNVMRHIVYICYKISQHIHLLETFILSLSQKCQKSCGKASIYVSRRTSPNAILRRVILRLQPIPTVPTNLAVPPLFSSITSTSFTTTTTTTTTTVSLTYLPPPQPPLQPPPLPHPRHLMNLTSLLMYPPHLLPVASSSLPLAGLMQ